MITRARACTRCREYVVIDTNDLKNRDTIDFFEKNHKSYALVTLDFEELSERYAPFNLLPGDLSTNF